MFNSYSVHNGKIIAVFETTVEAMMAQGQDLPHTTYKDFPSPVEGIVVALREAARLEAL